jgi:hypothetical protein
MEHKEIIFALYRAEYKLWQILAHMMVREVNRPTAIRAITTALRLRPAEVDHMLESFENNI